MSDRIDRQIFNLMEKKTSPGTAFYSLLRLNIAILLMNKELARPFEIEIDIPMRRL